MKKSHIFSLISTLGIAGVVGLITLGSSEATSYTLDSSIATNTTSTVHFDQGGNDFNGMIWRNGEINETGGHIITLDGATKTCYKQVKGYYYNSQRGERIWPLDTQSLTTLKGINSSYNNLQFTGGFWRACSGEDEKNIYGQVTHTYNNTNYKLLMGVDYTANTNQYLPSFSGNMQMTTILGQYLGNGFLWDTQGGKASVQSVRQYLTGTSASVPTTTNSKVTTITLTTSGENLPLSYSITGDIETPQLDMSMSANQTANINLSGWFGYKTLYVTFKKDNLIRTHVLTIQYVNPGTLTGSQSGFSSVTTTGGTSPITYSPFTIVSDTGSLPTGNQMTGYLQMIGIKDILVSGATWSGTLLPPTLISTNPSIATLGISEGQTVLTFKAGDTGNATLIPLTSAGTPGTFILSVQTNQISKSLTIKRSSDGTTWATNTPQAACTTNTSGACTFTTDHLSYFALVVDTSKTTVSYGQSCNDTDGCYCANTVLTNGQACVAPVSIVGSSSTSAGGGARLVMDDCSIHTSMKLDLPGANSAGIDYSSSYYDRTCIQGSSSSSITSSSTTSLIEDIEGTRDTSSIDYSNSPYNTSLTNAYVYGYSIGLTDATTIQLAGMKRLTTRKELAHMLSVYAIKVLGLTPDPDKEGCSEFTDIGDLTDTEQSDITLACQLGLMGINTQTDTVNLNFKPNQIITRKQFGTTLSRMLFGDTYEGGEPYYVRHLYNLKRLGYLTNTNPIINERRGWIMQIMMKAHADTLSK